jgi:hypothetical protein
MSNQSLLSLQVRPGHPDFLDLPWTYPFQQVTYPLDGRYALALMLNEYGQRNYTLATTRQARSKLYG